MNFTIRTKLYGLGLFGLVAAIAVGIAGIYGISRVASGIESVSSTSSAIRSHLEASMFLDLTRSDVSKMMTSSGDAQDTAASELGDHQKLLRERLSAALGFARNGAAETALQKENKDLEAYLALVSQIAASRSNPAEVTKILGSFLQGYQDLRNEMDSDNDILQGEAKRAETSGQKVVARSKLVIIGLCVAASLVLLAVAFLTVRDIHSRLAQLIEWLKKMASGDLTLHAEDARQDELGEIIHWFNDSVARLREAIAKVASSAGSVTQATNGLVSVSRQMTSHSEQTTTQASAAANTTDEVSRNLQTVATGTEEMNTSIRAIAKNVHEASEVAQQAVDVAQSTNELVTKLGASSAQIGEVVKVITAIAQQTNLLALNATIEAARAGEAGKGFAVVANEVKELAKQTGKATEDIRQRIDVIQADTKGSVEAIATICTIISQINQITGVISAAVEEQNATTSEMARNIAESAKGSSLIAKNIAGVAESAGNTSTGAHELKSATDELGKMSAELHELVRQFKYEGGSTSNGHDLAASMRPV